jgi:hypothetical protein
MPAPARYARKVASQTPAQQHSPSPGPPLWESELQGRVLSSPVVAITPYSSSLVPSPARQPWDWRQSPSSPRGPPRGADSETAGLITTARALGSGPVYPPWLYGATTGGVNLSDPFPSMWCSALFLHVHPKKQVFRESMAGSVISCYSGYIYNYNMFP